jgi:hypothetical protein
MLFRVLLCMLAKPLLFRRPFSSMCLVCFVDVLVDVFFDVLVEMLVDLLFCRTRASCCACCGTQGFNIADEESMDCCLLLLWTLGFEFADDA